MLHINLVKAVELITGEIEKESKGKNHAHTTSCVNVSYKIADHRDPDRYENMHDSEVGDVDNIVFEYIKGSCIVGRALISGGIDPKDFPRYAVSNSASDATLTTFERKGLLTYTPIAAVYLSAVQRKQDTGNAWGKAHLFGLIAALGWSKINYSNLHSSERIIVEQFERDAVNTLFEVM